MYNNKLICFSAATDREPHAGAAEREGLCRGNFTAGGMSGGDNYVQALQLCCGTRQQTAGHVGNG